MKKIILLISLVLINFSVYSQSIPTSKQFLNFLKENNFTCNSIDYEEVYSNYGYDVEDDVSQLIDSIDSYCKYLIPNYFEEFEKIRTANDNLIKTLKSNDFKYLNYTSLLAFTIFQDIGIVPNEVKIEAADNTRPPYSAFYDGFIGKIPGDNNSYNGVLGDKYPGYSFIQTSHDFSKKLDEFKVGDKSRILAFINSNDELIKQIIYNIYFEKVDDDRVWKISDVEKEITCRFGKDKFGKCVDKVDISINTIIEYIGSWDRKISKEKIDWDWATWGLKFGFRSKYLIANAVFNENLIIFLERIFDTKVFLSGPHDKGMNFNSSNEFGRYNPEFIKKLITSAEEILSNPFYLNLIRPIYKNHLEDMVITYQATSELFKIHKKYFPQYLNEATKIYLISLETGNQDLLPEDNFAVQTVFGDWTFESDVSEEAGIEIPDYDYDKLNYYNYYTALNFWGRRNIDGTDKLFSELLELVIEKISDDKVDISNATIKEDKVDKDETAYVIATNINIRNKPNVSESNVLFQLNKVAWYKPDFDSRYVQENWLSYPATPIEIIDSAIADGNTWYKIKGTKLTKEEISNLSKWSNWNIVRDSLFNLDKEGYPIRENNDREHWIYHTLAHRSQNNSFKDGKYSASIVVEDWFKEIEEKVNFTIDGDDVKGELSYSSSLTDGAYCKLYGEKSTNGRHLSLKSTCYSEGDEYEGWDYQITIMDNNAFKLIVTSRGENSVNFYRYEFEEIDKLK